MSENRTSIAVIGLGAMGLPMATHLATAFSVTGFDPFEPRRQLAAGQGIVAEATPEAASKNADIALLAVRDQNQAESALFGEDGVLEALRADFRLSHAEERLIKVDSIHHMISSVICTMAATGENPGLPVPRPISSHRRRLVPLSPVQPSGLDDVALAMFQRLYEDDDNG